MEVAPQYEGEFDRKRRPGEVLVQWRNKQVHIGQEQIDRHWHKYKWMMPNEAETFLRECAPNSNFFEYRIYRKLDSDPGS